VAHKILAEEYPAFPYEKNGDDYKEDVIDEGLLRGYLSIVGASILEIDFYI